MKALYRNAIVALSLSLSAITIIAASTLSSQAAVPTNASVAKLIKVTKTLEMLNDISNDKATSDQTMKETLTAIPGNDNEGGDSQEVINSDATEDFNQQIIKAYTKSAKQHYTQQEVDAMIAFYSSDVGQSIITKQPAVVETYMQALMLSIAELMRE